MKANEAGSRSRDQARLTSTPRPAAHPTATLPLHIQPRARRTEVVGWHGAAVKIRLAAPPVDGAANDMLVGFLADALGVPRSAVRLVAGAASRTKRVAIDGVTTEDALRRLGLGDPH